MSVNNIEYIAFEYINYVREVYNPKVSFRVCDC
jgi:hypothetical protein